MFLVNEWYLFVGQICALVWSPRVLLSLPLSKARDEERRQIFVVENGENWVSEEGVRIAAVYYVVRRFNERSFKKPLVVWRVARLGS